MGFTNWPPVSTIKLPVCDNAAPFCLFVYLFPLSSANPSVLVSDSPSPPSSWTLMFCFFLCCQFTWVLYWFGISMHEVNVLNLEWQSCNCNMEGADTGIMLDVNDWHITHYALPCLVSVTSGSSLAYSLCQAFLFLKNGCECVFAVSEVFYSLVVIMCLLFVGFGCFCFVFVFF